MYGACCVLTAHSCLCPCPFVLQAPLHINVISSDLVSSLFEETTNFSAGINNHDKIRGPESLIRTVCFLLMDQKMVVGDQKPARSEVEVQWVNM